MRRLSWLQSVASISTFIGVSLLATLAFAQTSHVVSIEEHWELRVAQPDYDRSAPQTTMVMSPTGDMGGAHFLFTLNHAPAPEYALGGLQVQLWNGEDFVESHTAHNGTSLDSDGEVVSWVEKISLLDGQLSFQVRDGHSDTWGDFGGDELSLSIDSPVNTLNHYKTSVSLGESQVNYAENRVSSLTLTKLVWVTDDGTVHEQNAPIPIDISLDN